MANKTTTKRRAKPRKRRPAQSRTGTRVWRRLGGCILLGLLVCAGLHYGPQLDTLWPRPTAPLSRDIADTSELQIALARRGFSPGSIDGVRGAQTRLALQAYQRAAQLPASGELDAATSASLKIQMPVYRQRRLSQQDFMQIGPKPNSWRARGTLPRMHYNSILEMVAEQALSDPDFIAALNPQLDWQQLRAGSHIRIPDLAPYRIEQPAAYIQIQLSSRTLRVFDTAHQLLFHCPVSIARRVEKRPRGELRVKVLVEEPNYTFNPAILSASAQREGIRHKFIIQPGPNNPVGSAWIGLNRPSYGIHGTPEPEQVGRSESSGCFRLANWNAHTVLDAAWVNMPVHVQP